MLFKEEPDWDHHVETKEVGVVGHVLVDHEGLSGLAASEKAQGVAIVDN